MVKPVNDSAVSTAERYRRFAVEEARGQSASYEEWALGVAADPEIVALIDELPLPKRQVNLVFAAARVVGAEVGPYAEFREWLVHNWPAVRDIALARSTQTNEAGRCATLLPLLASLPQPLALIEVGASAGLCLSPDRYSYDYDGSEVHPTEGPSEVLLSPRISGVVPIPKSMPTIVWRAGLDLNPLDVDDSAHMAWLEALIWPEHEARRRRLTSAIRLAQADPARVIRSDAVTGVAALAAEAPAGATLVIFHSAVLAYFSKDDRDHFVEIVTGLPGHWISNEGQSVLPAVSDRLLVSPDDPSLFVVSLDGNPVALAGGHGQSLHWLD